MNIKMSTDTEEYEEIALRPHLHTPVNGIELKHVLPDGCTIIGFRVYDQDCPNPCTDCDGMGYVRSFGNRHINHIDGEEGIALLKKDPMVVPLSYFEHGNCLWDVQGGSRYGSCPDKQWDGVGLAGVWIPDKCCRDEIIHRFRKWKKENNLTKTDKKTRQAKYHEIANVLAQQCCEEYTEWANGNCYGYVIQKFDAHNRYMKELDAVWGFIGDYSEEALKEAFNSAIVPTEPASDCGEDIDAHIPKYEPLSS